MRLKASASVPISSRVVTATRASKQPAAMVFALSVILRIGSAKRRASHKPKPTAPTSVANRMPNVRLNDSVTGARMAS